MPKAATDPAQCRGTNAESKPCSARAIVAVSQAVEVEERLAALEQRAGIPGAA